MSTKPVTVSSVNTSRLPSPLIWGDCPVLEIMQGTVNGIFHHDDFLGWNPTTLENYEILVSEGSGALVPTLEGGVFKLAVTNTDNNEANISFGPAEAVLGKVSITAARKLWWEACFQVSSVADDVAAVAIGLGSAGMSVANLQTDDTGVLKDVSHIAFRSVHVNGGTTGTNAVLGVVHKLLGQTAQVDVTTALTMVAGTWYKVGMKFVPTSATAGTVYFYVDNALVGSISDISAATFPYDVMMTFFAAIKAGSATASYMYIDWWRFAALRDAAY